MPYVAVAGLLVVAAVALLAVRIRPGVHVGGRRPGPNPDRSPNRRSRSGPRRCSRRRSRRPRASPRPRRPVPGRLHEAMEGLRFIRRQPALLGAISPRPVRGAVRRRRRPAARDRQGPSTSGPSAWAGSGPLPGIGAALMTLGARLAARAAPRRRDAAVRRGRLRRRSRSSSASPTASRSPSSPSLVLSAADAISVFIRATLVPLITPEDKRGRVLAVEMVFIGASNELGGFESGVAGQLIGVDRCRRPRRGRARCSSPPAGGGSSPHSARSTASRASTARRSRLQQVHQPAIGNPIARPRVQIPGRRADDTRGHRA